MGRWPRPLLVCLVLVAGPLRAEPDADLHAAIAVALATKADPDVMAALATRLAGGMDLLSIPEAQSTAASTPAKVRTGEMQAALTQLSILSGANGHLSLQLAQGGRTDVIYLLSGTAHLADLEAAGDLIRREGVVWRLVRPLVVWPGAALSIAPGEVLEMDTAAGAFLLSFGAVSMTGATLRGDGGQNPIMPGFRPFLLVTGQGTLRAEGSDFEALGFRGPVAFRGVSVMTAGVMKPAVPPVVANNSFSDVFSLSFEGADGMTVTANRFSDALAAAVSVKDGRQLMLAGNRIIGTANGAGIRLSGTLEKVVIAGNLIQDGGRNGVQIDGTTAGLILKANVVTGNAGAGVALGNASCVTVHGNIIAGNGTSGLKLADSGGAEIAGNAILSNGSAGIDVQGQTGLAPVVLADNVLARNREGLRAAGLGEVELRGNDLAAQTPRQFAGDFAPWLADYLATDKAFLIPAAAGTVLPAAQPCQTE
jgi:mannuronan 5-epimerase